MDKILANLALILGGARSGKSSYAIQIARSSKTGDSSLFYVVTADSGDEEMRARIDKHKADRDAEWLTIEASKNIASSLGKLHGRDPIVVIDCWSFYVANILSDASAVAVTEENMDPLLYRSLEKKTTEETNTLLRIIDRIPGKVLVVSNEVGLGLVPPFPMGRCFRDLLGQSHQMLAKEAAKVYFMLAGIPMELKKAPTPGKL